MKKQKLTASSFEKLSDSEKEAIYQECENITWEDSRPLTAKERRQWEAMKRGPGRPKKGSGVSVISLSVENDLLKTVDAFAKARGLNRSEFFSRGAKVMLAANAVA